MKKEVVRYCDIMKKLGYTDKDFFRDIKKLVCEKKEKKNKEGQ